MTYVTPKFHISTFFIFLWYNTVFRDNKSTFYPPPDILKYLGHTGRISKLFQICQNQGLSKNNFFSHFNYIWLSQFFFKFKANIISRIPKNKLRNKKKTYKQKSNGQFHLYLFLNIKTF